MKNGRGFGTGSGDGSSSGGTRHRDRDSGVSEVQPAPHDKGAPVFARKLLQHSYDLIYRIQVLSDKGRGESAFRSP